MHRSVRLCALLAVLVVVPSLAGQTPDKPDLQAQEEAAALREKGALAILDQALANTRHLKLPQNRIAVETEILQTLWGRDRSRSDALLNQIVSEFTLAASETSKSNKLAVLRQQRQQLVQFLAAADPGTAMHFLTVTRPYLRCQPAEQEEAEERQIELNLASQAASRDPRLGLQLAEKKLAEANTIPFELLGVLNVLGEKDRAAASKLLQEIVSRLQQSDLTSNPENFNFAVNLLSTSPAERGPGKQTGDSGGEAEITRGLAEEVASAMLSPTFSNDLLSSAQVCLPALERLAPSQVQSVKRKVADYRQTMNPSQKSWEEFNQAQQNGRAEQLLAVARQAPTDVRDSMYQQITSKLAGEGDFARSRQIAQEEIADPEARDEALQSGLQQAASAALQKRQIELARQLAEQINPQPRRAEALVQLAIEAAGIKKEAFALDLPAEADSLQGARAQNVQEFSGLMQLVQAFARWKVERAVQLLDRSAKQVNQVLAAAAQVDGFMPMQISFEQGELVLSNSFLMNSLVQQYAQAAASLADRDLETARNMADRIARPEARLMAEIVVARTALNQYSGRAYFPWGRQVAYIQE